MIISDNQKFPNSYVEYMVFRACYGLDVCCYPKGSCVGGLVLTGKWYENFKKQGLVGGP